MKPFQRRFFLGVTALAGALALPISVAGAADFAGDNNYQVGCFTLTPPGNQRLSPGLNNGHSEGELAFCNIVIDGNSLDNSQSFDGDPSTYDIELIVPTWTNFDNRNANGITDILVTGSYGAGSNSMTDIDGTTYGDNNIPVGHPLIGDPHILGVFANGSLANVGTLNVSTPTFTTGPSEFSGDVTGVLIPVEISGFGGLEVDRIDFFFAIKFAEDGLRKCTGGNGGAQDFPCVLFPPPGGSALGAASWFPGPGPLWLGYHVQESTGISTVPFKILGADEPEFTLSSIDGVKFCDVDVDGSCSGENLVNGTDVTVWVCDLDGDASDCTNDDIVAVFTTGAVGVPGDASQPYSQASLEIAKKGQKIDTDFQILPTASDGAYSLFVSRVCEGKHADGLGALTIQVAEAVDPIFDRQTAPDPGDTVDTFTAADGTDSGLNVYWSGTLACDGTVSGLDFGNVTLEPAEGDPHTIGFWGAKLIKSAINSDADASAQCPYESPGENVLPVFDGQNTYNTPEEVETLLKDATASCSTFDFTGLDTAGTLCKAATYLPPKKFDNPLGQLLGVLLNAESGLLPDNVFVNRQCLGIGNDDTPVPLTGILDGACSDPDAYQPLMAAINESDPVDGSDVLQCFVAPTCPDNDKVTTAQCPVLP